MIPRAALDSAVLDQKIALYSLEDGESCASLLSGLAGTLQLVLLASNKSGHHAAQNTQEVKTALNLCLSLMLTDKYQTKHTLAIADGLETALRMAPRISSLAIIRAWKEMQK
jgi:hypothetical protein